MCEYLPRKVCVNREVGFLPTVWKDVFVIGFFVFKIRLVLFGFEGVDDWSSECDLDSINNWDFVIRNSNGQEFNESFELLVDYLQKLSDIVH
jgi:hypothetical protein